MKRLGILGGMGPEAAIDLQHKVLAATPARTDEEHLAVLVWNVPQIPPRTPAILGNGPSPLPQMIQGMRSLEKMGAQIGAIACNTAHHWHADLQAACSIPVLHIADAVYAQLKDVSGIHSVGLLSTPGTLTSGFYQQRLGRLGLDVLLPGPHQAGLGLAINAIKSMDYGQAARAVDQVAQHLLDQGAQRLILGCTELPLVKSQLKSAGLCIDATDALAQAIVDVCWHGKEVITGGGV